MAKHTKKSRKPARKPARKTRKVKRRASTPQWMGYAPFVGMAVVVAAIGVLYVRRPMTESTKAPTKAMLSANAPAQATSKSQAKAPSHDLLAAEFKHAQGLPRGERVAYWSNQILTSKAVRNAIRGLAGDRTVDDVAPVVPDKFNCTTFVETVGALSRSNKAADFYGSLMAVRYKNGQPSFANRNHFPEADWIPNNAEAGILSDVTAQLAQQGGGTALVEKKKINRTLWLAKQLEAGKVTRSLASMAEKNWANPTAVQIQYVGFSDLPKVMPHIPTGTVMNLVHKSSDRKPVLISHQGFVIQEGGKTLFRHASSEGDLRTVDLATYLSKLRKKGSSSWPLVGLNLNQFN